jgi:hypothetical protein
MSPAGQPLSSFGDIADLQYTNKGEKMLTNAVTVLLIFPIGPKSTTVKNNAIFSALKDSRVYEQLKGKGHSKSFLYRHTGKALY